MPAVVITAQADGATIVAAPSPSQFIRVLGGELTPVAATTVSLKSGTTVIWNNASGAGVPMALNVDPNRTIDCAPGQALKLGSGSGNVNGTLEYVVKGLPDPNLLAGQ